MYTRTLEKSSLNYMPFSFLLMISLNLCSGPYMRSLIKLINISGLIFLSRGCALIYILKNIYSIHWWCRLAVLFSVFNVALQNSTCADSDSAPPVGAIINSLRVQQALGLHAPRLPQWWRQLHIILATERNYKIKQGRQFIIHTKKNRNSSFSYYPVNRLPPSSFKSIIQ